MTAGVRDYEIALQPYDLPAVVEGFSFQICASTQTGRIISGAGSLPAADHTIGLVLVDLPSGLISANLVWRHGTEGAGGFGAQHRTLLNPAAPNGSLTQLLRDCPDAAWTRRGKNRHGVIYILSIGRPVVLGPGTEDVPKLREEARLAEAKRVDMLNALHGLWRAHGGRTGS